MLGRSSRNTSRSCPSISCCRYFWITPTLSNVELTWTPSSGSFLNTSVMPLLRDTTSTTIARSFMDESRTRIGTTSGLAAKSMPRDAAGLLNRPGSVCPPVASGFACTVVDSTRYASPAYVSWKMPRKRSLLRSPISRISSSGGTVPILSSCTWISPTITLGFGPRFSAVLTMFTALS